jgi:hypothetical protein
MKNTKLKFIVELEISDVKKGINPRNVLKSIIKTGINMSDYATGNWATGDKLCIDKVSVK